MPQKCVFNKCCCCCSCCCISVVHYGPVLSSPCLVIASASARLSGAVALAFAGAVRNVQHQKRLKATAVRVFGGFFAVSNDDDGRWPRHQIAGTIADSIRVAVASPPSLFSWSYCGSGSEANRMLTLLETILQI